MARFALSYCLYLDRHTRPGHRVAGHPGLRRSGFGSGVRYGLLGTAWLPVLVRRFLADGLGDLGLPRGLWYDVALAGLGEIAAGANDEDFGADHLSLLASAADPTASGAEAPMTRCWRHRPRSGRGRSDSGVLAPLVGVSVCLLPFLVPAGTGEQRRGRRRHLRLHRSGSALAGQDATRRSLSPTCWASPGW